MVACKIAMGPCVAPGPPPPEMQDLFTALRGNQADTNRFLGTVAGTMPIPEFFAPENTQRILAVG